MLSGHTAIQPVSGVSTLVLRAGRVLIVKRANRLAHGLWSLPGGHVEAGELLREAAVREVREETGILCTITGVVDCTGIINRGQNGQVKHHYIVTVYSAAWQAGTAVAGSDAAAVKWAGPGDVAGLNMTPGTAGLIINAIKVITQN